MQDGLYRVEYKAITAGFITKGGELVACAPTLFSKPAYWKSIAAWIEP